THGLLGWVSPAGAGLLASDLAYQAHPSRFWGALFGNHTLGWLLLIVASICLPRCWQERSVPKHFRVRPDRQRPEGRLLEAAKSTALRVRLLEINPIYWL